MRRDHPEATPGTGQPFGLQAFSLRITRSPQRPEVMRSLVRGPDPRQPDAQPRQPGSGAGPRTGHRGVSRLPAGVAITPGMLAFRRMDRADRHRGRPLAAVWAVKKRFSANASDKAGYRKSDAPALKLSAGDRIRYILLHGGEVRLVRVGSVKRLNGVLAHARQSPVTLETMDLAISEGASGWLHPPPTCWRGIWCRMIQSKDRRLPN